MAKNLYTDNIIATGSGLIGGTFKIITGSILTINSLDITEILIYASLSAITGLVSKDIYNFFKSIIKKLKR